MVSKIEFEQIIVGLQERIDELDYVFFDADNGIDFREELDTACHALNDALLIIERDESYKLALEKK